MTAASVARLVAEGPLAIARPWRWRVPVFVRLVLLMLVLMTASEVILALLTYGRLRRELEADLARRLDHAAQLLALETDAALVSQFRPGDESLGAYRLVTDRLAAEARALGVQRAYIVDTDLRTLADSDARAVLGRPRYALLVNRASVRQALAGRTVHTQVYADEEGQLRLTALAPLRDPNDAVIAFVGADASPEFFAPLATLRRQMIAFGVASVIVAAILGGVLARQISARLTRLRTLVSHATHGAFETRTPPAARDEIGALARDLDRLIGSALAFERRAQHNEQLAALGSMAGALLHEIRNPLASVILYVDLLRPTLTTDEARELWTQATTHATRLTEFLADFQIFAGLRPLRREWVSARVVMDDAIASVQTPPRVTIARAYAIDADLLVDRRLLRHALRNLIVNACEATASRGGRLTAIVDRDPARAELRLGIADDGAGIAEAQVGRIFDPLYTTKPTGSGLGLTIVQRVVEAHHASVDVTSVAGAGTTFVIRWPADAVRSSEEEAAWRASS